MRNSKLECERLGIGAQRASDFKTKGLCGCEEKQNLVRRRVVPRRVGVPVYVYNVKIKTLGPIGFRVVYFGDKSDLNDP